MTIEISESLRDWIEIQTRAGGHKSSAEFLETLIRTQQCSANRSIDDSLRKGLESGAPIQVNEAFWAERRRVLPHSRK